MSRIARNQADARLSRDGSVKLKGKRVGVWWKDGDFDVFHVYHFALKTMPRSHFEPHVPA